MKAIIIEDEYPAAERLEKLITAADSSFEICAVLDSVEGAVSWLNTHQPPDVVFADIQLSDGLSFQIFEQVPVRSPIIFTTSYDEYAIKAFKHKSIDYLLKPIKPKELESAIQKLNDTQSPAVSIAKDYAMRVESLIEQLGPKRYKTRFLVRQHEQLVPVPVHEVAYFYTTNEMVCMVLLNGGQHLIDYTLEKLEKCLDPAHFLRINRQYIAHLPAIRQIHQYFNGKLKLELMPNVDGEVTVSREKVPDFKRWVEEGS